MINTQWEIEWKTGKENAKYLRAMSQSPVCSSDNSSAQYSTTLDDKLSIYSHRSVKKNMNSAKNGTIGHSTNI